MLQASSVDTPSDYHFVKKALTFISDNWREQPSLDSIASSVNMSPFHLQRVFTRWAGLSPKAFLQAITIDQARALLRDSASVLDTAYEVGLSGPGRLHDLFITHEGMTPGAYKARGAGLTIRYGFHPSPFGTALLLVAGDGLVGLAFAEDGEEPAVLRDMTSRWPQAAYAEDSAATAALAARVFSPDRWQPDQPLKVTFIGTDFDIRVWRTLLRVPFGKRTTYSDIAAHLGSPKAARAVGAAVGRNPISFVVPCHRVLGKSGSLCGYHWGLTRKRAMLGWEAGLA
ncbi:MAG: methylated-DNA--[protein]-cysteine S-methyltransferase [Pseudomonadota bacterium]|nr:methylated-DNA--[protein]-cysteine S-methyltransferase [Pseudomonadota bacterium]